MGVRLQEANGCKSCGAALSGRRLDLGRLPACNRFLSRNVGSDTHPLVMAECPSCGLVQLAICPPPKFVMPRVPWIRYREPEAHLDDVVARLMPSLPPSARALGVGPFDGPLMERLGGRGFGHDLLDLIQGDASGGPGCYPYLETVQARLPALNPATVGSGAVDLVVCRYLLEHSHDPVAALLGLKCLLAPTGKLLIEVPDC
jgi:SAM-dependent methyltransferase